MTTPTTTGTTLDHLRDRSSRQPLDSTAARRSSHATTARLAATTYLNGVVEVDTHVAYLLLCNAAEATAVTPAAEGGTRGALDFVERWLARAVSHDKMDRSGAAELADDVAAGLSWYFG